jgi:hypothetical protein
MKIFWNKITWYSKALALMFFVLLPIAGFFFGLEAGYLKGYVDGTQIATLGSASTSTIAADNNLYYQDIAKWQTSRNDAGGFSIAYPLDFAITESSLAAPTTDWRVNGNGTVGNAFFELNIPKAFESQTNFGDAKLTVGASKNASAVVNCLVSDPSGIPANATSTEVINGIAFTVFHSNDAGAGNFYETTSYRTVRAGQCWAIEYTIHSSQIGNYPPEYGLQPFDKAKLTDVLDRIVSTFKFL